MNTALAIVTLVLVSSLTAGFAGPTAPSQAGAAGSADASRSLQPPSDSSLVRTDRAAAPIAVPDSRLPATTRSALSADGRSLPASATGLPEDGENVSEIGVGSTRFFLSLDEVLLQQYFKEYELRTVGDHVEIWVATDLGWPTGDPREAPVVTDPRPLSRPASAPSLVPVGQVWQR